MSTPRDSNLLRGGKRINPRPRRAARRTDHKRVPIYKAGKSICQPDRSDNNAAECGSSYY